jgi:hypothetical protein
MQGLAIVAVLLVAVTMGLALAHALELPGKLRLDEAGYRTVQTIYYPGFTLGGLVGEFGALLVLPVLLYLTPFGTGRFWWTAAALGLLILGHAVYWLVTHPVNRAWLRGTRLPGAASAFFALRPDADGDWTRLRAVWEYSHVARAVLGLASLGSLARSLVV